MRLLGRRPVTEVTAPYTVVTFLCVRAQLGAHCQTERWALPPALLEPVACHS